MRILTGSFAFYVFKPWRWRFVERELPVRKSLGGGSVYRERESSVREVVTEEGTSGLRREEGVYMICKFLILPLNSVCFSTLLMIFK